MKRFIAPLAIFSGSLAWFLIWGFQGASPAEIDQLDRARMMASGTWAVHGPQPLADVLAALALQSLPAGNLTASWLGATILTSLAAVLVFCGARDAYRNTMSGIAAATLFAGSAHALWSASGTLPGALGLVLAATIPIAICHRRPGVRHIVLGLSGGLSVLGALPLFPIFFGLWIADLFRYKSGVGERGETPAFRVPISWFGAALAVILLPTLVHPGFWNDTADTWKLWLDDALSWAPGVFHWYGTPYVESRPPIWTGLVALITETSTVLLPLAAVGLASSRLEDRHTVRFLGALGGLLFMPWVIRGLMWGDLLWNTAWLPIVAVHAGGGLMALLAIALDGARRGAQLTGVAICAIVLGAPPIEALAFREAPGAFRNALIRLPGALQRNDRARRDLRVSSTCLDQLSRTEEIAPGELEPLFQEFRRAGYVSGDSAPTAERVLFLVESRYSRPVLDIDHRVTSVCLVDGVPLAWVSEAQR